MSSSAVPVLMHHSIGVPNPKWVWSHLTCPFGVFESQLKWLKKKNFHSVSLMQLYNHMKQGDSLPDNSFVLTLDDGYLDNWVFAYPLLKKYGFTATLYVATDFIDPCTDYRANLDDFWDGKVKMSDLRTTGFLSWRELEEMENSGVLDIQSHAVSHTWYPCGNEIVDFRHPGDPYIWMSWNAEPEQKPFLQTDREDLKHFGQPVYEHGKSLEVRRYFPDEDLSDALERHVRENGGEDFFKEGWRTKLFAYVDGHCKGKTLSGRVETEKEHRERVRKELSGSKNIIEKQLNKKVYFLCWPGGGKSQETAELAREIGYLSTTYASREIRGRQQRNRSGDDPSAIVRMGTTLCWDGRSPGGRIKYQSGFKLLLSIFIFQKRTITAKLARLILAFSRRACRLLWAF